MWEGGGLHCDDLVGGAWLAGNLQVPNSICRDMYYEKWGFMLIFWNLAGVPLSYCHCTLYLANHAPSQYHWNRYGLALLYVSYVFCYWVWDTCNSQKNRFRQQERGQMIERHAFLQLPWQTVKNPKMIKTKTGDSILVDGWCKFRSNLHLAFPSNWLINFVL